MRTLEEEVVNAYSHLLAAVVSLAICAIFLDRIDRSLHKIQFLIFGLTGTWTFFSSFLYHNTMKTKKRARNLVLDRVGIYLMITATGLSFSLGSVSDFSKLVFCSLVLAGGGYLVISYCAKRFENELYSVVSYLIFAIVCILPITGIFNENILVSEKTISLLIGGLLCYAAGVVFYTIDSKKWAHTAWHAFVTLGYAASIISMLVAFEAV